MPRIGLAGDIDTGVASSSSGLRAIAAPRQRVGDLSSGINAAANALVDASVEELEKDAERESRNLLSEYYEGTRSILHGREEDGSDGYLNQKSMKAVDGRFDSERRLREHHDRMAERARELGVYDRVQGAFNSRHEGSLTKIDVHVKTQRDIANEQSFNTRQKNLSAEAEAASAVNDHYTVNLNARLSGATAKKYAADQGMDEKRQNRAALEAESAIHVDHIQRLALTDAAAAKAYFEGDGKDFKGVKDRIDGNQHGDIAEVLRTASTKDWAIDHAIAIVGQRKSDSTLSDMLSMADEAVEAEGKSPEHRDELRQRVTDRYKVEVLSENQERTARMQGVLDGIPADASLGVQYAAVIARTKDPKDRAELNRLLKERIAIKQAIEDEQEEDAFTALSLAARADPDKPLDPKLLKHITDTRQLAYFDKVRKEARDAKAGRLTDRPTTQAGANAFFAADENGTLEKWNFAKVSAELEYAVSQDYWRNQVLPRWTEKRLAARKSVAKSQADAAKEAAKGVLADAALIEATAQDAGFTKKGNPLEYARFQLGFQDAVAEWKRANPKGTLTPTQKRTILDDMKRTKFLMKRGSFSSNIKFENRRSLRGITQDQLDFVTTKLLGEGVDPREKFLFQSNFQKMVDGVIATSPPYSHDKLVRYWKQIKEAKGF